MDTKKIKKIVKKNVEGAKSKSKDLEIAATREFKKIQKNMEDTSKKIGAYIKKNPEKAVLISVGIGAALGVTAALLIPKKGEGKKKK